MRRSEISDDIILVMPPTWQADMPPLGLAYLASFLSANNIKVEILDLNVKLFNACASKEKHLWDVSTISNFSQHYITRSIVKKFDKEIKAHIKIICDSPAKLIGFSVTFATVNVALNIAQQIKSKDPSKIIIFGGSGCFYDTLSIGEAKIVDIFVIGEGELPLLEIVKRFKAKPLLSNLFGIKGTIVLTNSSYHNFLPPNHAKDINIFPFPTFKGFDLDEYNQGFPNKSLPLLISRGCVNKCSFCIDHKMNYPFRYKDPNKVVEELKYHVYQNNKSAFRFNDLLCN